MVYHRCDAWWISLISITNTQTYMLWQMCPFVSLTEHTHTFLFCCFNVWWTVRLSPLEFGLSALLSIPACTLKYNFSEWLSLPLTVQFCMCFLKWPFTSLLTVYFPLSGLTLAFSLCVWTIGFADLNSLPPLQNDTNRKHYIRSNRPAVSLVDACDVKPQPVDSWV